MGDEHPAAGHRGTKRHQLRQETEYYEPRKCYLKMELTKVKVTISLERVKEGDRQGRGGRNPRVRPEGYGEVSLGYYMRNLHSGRR